MNDDRQRYAIHAAVFAALANPTRHELMHHLCDGPRTPSELAELLDVSRPNVSQHLAVLQREGLVKRSHAGRPRAVGGRRPATGRSLRADRRDPRSRACAARSRTRIRKVGLMFTQNESTTDRIVRTVVGGGLLVVSATSLGVTSAQAARHRRRPRGRCPALHRRQRLVPAVPAVRHPHVQVTNSGEPR